MRNNDIKLLHSFYKLFGQLHFCFGAAVMEIISIVRIENLIIGMVIKIFVELNIE